MCARAEAEYRRLDGEMHAAASRYYEITRQVMATPAKGREGLAVKALVVKHRKERLWDRLIDEMLA
jgi:hypothetical protein